MPPFVAPTAIVQGFKERPECITVKGDRLYVGSSTGTLFVYGIDESANTDAIATLVDTKKNFTRRSVDQLGFIKDINSLVALSESVVTLFPLPSLAPPTPLIKAKAAFSFALHTHVSSSQPDGNSGETGRMASIPTVETCLLVGCRRKAVIYSWKDGEAQEVKEAPLPHSARTIWFLDNTTACFAYSPTEYAMFSLKTLAATDITLPTSLASTVPGMGALSGLTGYMTLGLGAKAKPCMTCISDSEAFIAKDDQGFVVGADAKVTKAAAVIWPAPPEEIAFVKPYLVSILPSGTVHNSRTDLSTEPTSATSTLLQTPVVQIHSSLSFFPVQTLPYPFHSTVPVNLTANATLRLITPSPSAKSPLFFITTPTDRSLAAAEGSSIWKMDLRPWAEQIDEMVTAGQYANALDLLEILDQVLLPDKEQRRTRIRALNAVSRFRDKKFDDAINTFIELDLNPAKVVALYPDVVAGRLSVPRSGWISLYGGPDVEDDRSSHVSDDSPKEDQRETPQQSLEPSSPAGNIKSKPKAGLGGLIASGAKDDDAVSITGKSKTIPHDDLHRSVETLVRYLSDRRPKVAGALSAVHITPAQSHQITSLSETSVEELFMLPNAPLSSLTPEQLVRFAQIVDTALFKSYLIIRPGLIGSLCRVANWCEVSEVEEELRARGKYAELIDLYHGKKMHDKALSLLRQLSDKLTDMREKLQPSISYLQKLGPEHMQQVFDCSRWLFEQDRNMAFEVFTSEDVELPRQSVADFLDSIDRQLCARYLEFLINERKETEPRFHDRLAESYLSMTLAAKKKGNPQLQKEFYSKLLHFIDTTDHYRTERLYGILSSEDLFEARAILLGRLGRHDQALELYVYRLQDFKKAEEYCKRIYQSNTDARNVYLTLLRIYLRPTTRTPLDLLPPALDLISRHSPRLDAVETLQLLPPLVTAHDVRTFLLEALRAPIFDTRAIREISKSRNDQLARELMILQAKRVKVTDSRICPQCHKRIGNSVIAVHAPRGEVTHYQCREEFSRRLHEMRR